jgi:hypothetical protein
LWWPFFGVLQMPDIGLKTNCKTLISLYTGHRPSGLPPRSTEPKENKGEPPHESVASFVCDCAVARWRYFRLFIHAKLPAEPDARTENADRSPLTRSKEWPKNQKNQRISHQSGLGLQYAVLTE